MIQGKGYFAIPIWEYNLSRDVTKEEFQEINNFCLNLKKNNPGRVRSNSGGWQSFDFTESGIVRTPLYNVFKHIPPILQSCMADLGSTTYISVKNAWVNINGKEHYNHPHNHPRSTLSGVCYITDNNSTISFERPADIFSHLLEDIDSKGNTMVSHSVINFTPTKGMLLIFPSSLKHSVRPNESDGERISIAFNASF